MNRKLSVSKITCHKVIKEKNPEKAENNEEKSLQSNYKCVHCKEDLKLKSIGKQQAQEHFSAMSNFYKLWANVEGYSVADGSVNGGLFLRNVCKLFKDIQYIKKSQMDRHYFKNT